MALTVRRVAIANYRSIRRIAFPLEPLTVFVGANGTGKTNLYRALQLAQFAARGTLSAEIAGEGGMEAVFWAGRLPKNEALRIAVEVELGPAAAEGPAVLAYGFEIGFRMLTMAAFPFEPQVKTETLHRLSGRRRTLLLERRGPRLAARREGDGLVPVELDLLASETALSRLEDAGAFPEIDLARRSLLDWRFHHALRTDPQAPMRRPALAVASPTLDADGANLAAVLATLVHIREDTAELDAAIADAFPGARLDVPEPGREASFGLSFREHPQRVFGANELSDGTLRYLSLAGALLAYRRPALLAFNEPEASLHPDLLPPLARLIARAADGGGSIWLVTHSPVLADALAKAGGLVPRRVEKDREGATSLAGLTRFGDFAEVDTPGT
ncbi:AAA family ATPase [Antarcticirhabdus aurantiaca]|uniref:AAA family ATPase n=1 Tax=Antarcticirhabdus aurantiaca TaxID=2606717 RepID=A0ACD4NJV2_9HYPH|nr:AAA family ATPase [Antarcticirhabdus aurantiaca]WAJ27090.1 AAA family ATPase [Jeongeuplla avenae]